MGSLTWLSISTHPDIANAVRAVARYCTAPRAIHWKAALRIFEYINGTSEYGITFQRGTLSGISLKVFADADYASKATDRRSVSGGLIMCGGANVCWFTRTQKCVTLSTSEAEYVALGHEVKDLLFLRQIWRFMLPSKGRFRPLKKFEKFGIFSKLSKLSNFPRSTMWKWTSTSRSVLVHFHIVESGKLESLENTPLLLQPWYTVLSRLQQGKTRIGQLNLCRIKLPYHQRQQERASRVAAETTN